LAETKDTAAQVATMRCPHQQTSGPAVCRKQTYHHPNQAHKAFIP